MYGHVLYARFGGIGFVNAACEHTDVALICIDSDVSQMDVLDNTRFADHVEQADVRLAVAHNVEIFNDVAFAVVSAVKARQHVAFVHFRRCRRYKQTAFYRHVCPNSRFKYVCEEFLVSSVPVILLFRNVAVVVCGRRCEERIENLDVLRRERTRYVFRLHEPQRNVVLRGFVGTIVAPFALFCVEEHRVICRL